MIYIIIYFVVMTVLSLISFRKEIYCFYCIVTQKRMINLFPRYYDWEEGDKIIYMQNFDNDRIGYLYAMSEDSIVIQINGNTKEVYPYQIKENVTRESIKKKNKYKSFHEDVLPVISNKSNTFPKLTNKQELNKLS